jgi:hypothetical protein
MTLKARFALISLTPKFLHSQLSFFHAREEIFTLALLQELQKSRLMHDRPMYCANYLHGLACVYLICIFALFPHWHIRTFHGASLDGANVRLCSRAISSKGRFFPAPLLDNNECEGVLLLIAKDKQKPKWLRLQLREYTLHSV